MNLLPREFVRGEILYLVIFRTSPQSYSASPNRKWNLLIQNSTRNGFFSESLDLYSSLLKSGFHGDNLTFPSVVKACAHLSFLLVGKAIHSHIILLGFQRDIFIQTSVLHMYSKCSSLNDARKLFDEMPTRSVVSWNSMISAYAKELYTQDSFQLFNQMRSSSILPTSSTCVSLLSACSNSTSTFQCGLSVHNYAIKAGFLSDLRLCNSILCMYLRFSMIDAALSIFDSMNERSTITYTAIIGWYANLGDCFTVFDLFNQMRFKQISLDAIVFINLLSSCALQGNLLILSSVLSLLIRCRLHCEPDIVASVVQMYAKCGDITSAKKLFDSAIDKDILLWTSMIGAYSLIGLPQQALDLFKDLGRTNLQPNKVTILTVLSACANIGMLSTGQQIVELINAYDLRSDLQVQTSMIHMYSKCGSLELAKGVFDSISCKDLAALSSMINCYALHGKGEEALVLFKVMLRDRSIKPDAVVFTDVLSACSHCGLVEEGLECFRIMQHEYGIEASKEHYSCFVHLLSREGYFDEALGYIHLASDELRGELWTPFLSGLRENSSVCCSNTVFKKYLKVGIESAGDHLLLASLSASLGQWKEARHFRSFMDRRGLRKEAGCSKVELCS